MIGRVQSRGARLWSRYRGELLGVLAVFGIAALYMAIQAARVDAYAIFVDELLYTKAAQGFADNPFSATIFSEPYPVPNALYARLIALPYGLLGNLNAFIAAHVLNALVFASVAIPLYLLARRLDASPRWALFAAALGTWIPWAIATLVLMSESLAYPAFAWAILAGVVAIADPRPRNDVLLLVALIGMLYARTQFLVVLPAFAVAFVIHELAWPERQSGDLRARLRRHWVLGAGALAVALFLLLKGSEVLGNYGRVADVPRFPPGLLESMADHLTHVVLGVGVVPVLLWVIAIARWGGAPATRYEHVFAYLSGPATLLLVYQSGFYARQIAGGNLQERYTFYIAAVFVVAAGAVLSRPPRRLPVGPLVAATALAMPIVGSAVFTIDAGSARTILAAASGFNTELVDLATSLRPRWTVAGTIAGLVVLVAVATAGALAAGRFRRTALPVLAGLTLLFCVYETHFVFNRAIPAVNSAIPTVLGHPPKAWVDGLLYTTDDEAGAIEGDIGEGDTASLWQWTEFWNSRITRVYTLPKRNAYSLLPGTPIEVDPATGRLSTEPELPTLVVSAADPTIAIRGEVVRRTDTALQLIRPVRPYQADWMLGDTTNPALGRTPMELSLYQANGTRRSARVTLELTASAELKRGQGSWVVEGDDERLTGTLAREESERLSVDVRFDPNATRATVGLSAPDAGKKSAIVVRSVGVEWNP